MKELARHTHALGLPLDVTEGANHTKVRIGDLRTTVPRHREINEVTARAILKQMGVQS